MSPRIIRISAPITAALRRGVQAQSNLRRWRQHDGFADLSTFLPSTAQWQWHSVTRRLAWSISVTVDLGMHHVAGAHGGQELERLGQDRRCRGPEAVRRSPPRSGRRSACHGRCGPRRSCPAHNRRRDGPGFGRSKPRRTSRYRGRSPTFADQRIMPISMILDDDRAARQIVQHCHSASVIISHNRKVWMCNFITLRLQKVKRKILVSAGALSNRSDRGHFCFKIGI